MKEGGSVFSGGGGRFWKSVPLPPDPHPPVKLLFGSVCQVPAVVRRACYRAPLRKKAGKQAYFVNDSAAFEKSIRFAASGRDSCGRDGRGRHRVPALLRSSAIARGTGHPVHPFHCVTGGPGAAEGPVRHDYLPQTCIKVFGRMGECEGGRETFFQKGPLSPSPVLTASKKAAGRPAAVAGKRGTFPDGGIRCHGRGQARS